MRRRMVIMFALAALITAAAGAAQDAQERKTPSPGESVQNTRFPAAQPVNIKMDLTITDQRDGQTSSPKTTTIMVADRERGQIRSMAAGGQALDLDLRPEILRDSRLRVNLTLNYRAPQTDSDKTPPNLTQSIGMVIDDGKPLVISQWSEIGSNRAIRVELRAAIQK